MHRLHDVWQFSETSLKHRIVNKTDIAHPQRWVSPIFRTPQQQVHPPGIRTFSSTSTGTSISTTLEENNGQSGAAVHSPLYNKTSWCGSVPLITVIIILSKFNPIFCSVLPHKSDLKPTRGLIVPVLMWYSCCTICKVNKTISDGGITVDFWFIKVHTSN